MHRELENMWNDVLTNWFQTLPRNLIFEFNISSSLERSSLYQCNDRFIKCQHPSPVAF
jgi:hypothetical protein